jgi:hypothetical protein
MTARTPRAAARAVGLGYVAAALVFTWPLALHFGAALPAVFNGIDPLLQAYVLGWGQHALVTAPLGVFDAPMFHPERRTLTYMDALLGQAVLTLPLRALSLNVAAAYDALVVASFAASGWTAYRLLRYLGASRPAAFACGLLYVASPYRMSNLGNLNLLHTQLVPLALLFGIRFARRGRTRDLAGAAGVVAVQTAFGWYYAFHLAIALALLGGWARFRRWPGLTPFPWRRVLAAAALTAVVVLPLAWPYWVQHATVPGYRRSLGIAALYSADLLDHVRHPRENAVARALGLPTGDLAYFPGFVALALAVVGGLAAWRARRAAASAPGASADGYFGLLGVTSFVLSLGPVLQAAGRRLPVPLPFAVLWFVVPGFTVLRAPGRFAGLALLALLVFAARGYDRLGVRLGPRGAPALLAFVVALGVALGVSSPMPLVEFPRPEELPAAHRWIAAQPGAFAILELPMPASEAQETEGDARRQVWSLYHGKARADGVSGFVTPAHEAFRSLMQSFPDDAAVRAIVERGVRFVIVRYGEYAPAERARVRAQIAGAPLAPAFTAGDDVVYAVVGAELLGAGVRQSAAGRLSEK